MKLTNNYRAVGNNWEGHTVQIRRWWLPVWLPLGGIDTFLTRKEAERYIRTIEQ